MKSKSILTVLALALLLAIASTAWAKDQVQVKVSSVAVTNSSTSQLVSAKVGGDAYTQGDWADGNISLFFEVVGFSFPNGAFGSFDVGVAVKRNTSNPQTSYPLSITVAQPGAGTPEVQLGPSKTYSDVNFSAAANGSLNPVGSSSFTITIDCITNSCPTADNSTIAGNLQVASSENSLGTNRSIHVEIKLIHPPSSCLTLDTWVTDQEHTTTVTATDVNVISSGRNAGRVTSTTPYGQLSQNALINSTCAGQSFDLKLILDPNFETNPNNNPGIAVFAYTGSIGLSPTSYSTKTTMGQSLCLPNVSLNNGDAYLATVHMQIIRGALATGWSNPGTFTFEAELYPAGSNCSGTPSESDSTTVNYTLK